MLHKDRIRGIKSCTVRK